MAAARSRTDADKATNDAGLISTMLSITQAAQLLGVSEYQMRRLVATKAIPSVRVGYFIRVRESDVRDFVERQLTS